MPAYRYQQGDRPLDGYTIQHALGRGGFGEVYFAISDAGREVALKAIQNYEEIELRGIGHCMNLKSSHLVMIFDVRQDTEGMAWVIMEYVSGPNLREILDEAHVGSSLRDESENPSGLGETGLDGIGIEQAAFFLRELCKGLAYLHDAGVVHRDLKPHNVFFEDGVVKIGDYSLSKAITTSHRSGHTTTVGSVHYMAPEICEGRYDKTVDIYALGVILFEMLTGSPPHQGESMGEVLMKHLSCQVDVSGLPEPFDQVVAKAMRRDPEMRYQTASEMLSALSTEDELAYSRPPSSLSMIGDRAVKERAKRIQSGNVLASGLAETFATPVALHDTRDSTDSQPFHRPAAVDFNAMGLWWKRQPSLAYDDDPASIYVRLTIAAVVSLLLFRLGCAVDPNNWSRGDTLSFSVAFVVFNSLACWFFLSTLPRSGGLGWAIVTRAIAIIPMILVTGVSESLEQGEDYISVIFGLMTVYTILDTRCFVSADRYPRVSLVKTLVAGGIAAVATTLIDESERYAVFTGVMAVSSAIAIQVLAPLGHVVRVNSQVDGLDAKTSSQNVGASQSKATSENTNRPTPRSSSVDQSVTNQTG